MQGIAATGTTRTEALRKRRSGSAAEPEPEAASSHIASVVKSLDVYPKTLDDFKVCTTRHTRRTRFSPRPAPRGGAEDVATTLPAPLALLS